MNPLNLVKLSELMDVTRGRADVLIGLIDGPVASDHPGLAAAKVRKRGSDGIECSLSRDLACRHGTFVAGMLCGGTQSGALSICPECTLLSRPIFRFSDQADETPSAEAEELASAIADCVAAGASVLNLSVSLGSSSSQGEKALKEALDHVTRKRVLVVAAAGNEGTIYSSLITHHPWVISVAACDLSGQTLHSSNLSPSLGRRGLQAPGDRITSLGLRGQTVTLSGTSFAVPFVTGTVALLCSVFPNASATDIRMALVPQARTRVTIVPPLLNAAAAYQALSAKHSRRSA
jgi:subtilisin family serine protease